MTNLTRVSIGVTLSLTLGGVLAWQLHKDQPHREVPTRSGDAHLSAQVTDLRREIQQLRDNQSALALMQRATPPQHEAPAVPDSLAAPAVETAEIEKSGEEVAEEAAIAEAEAVARLKQRHDLMQSTLDGEPPDPKWSAAAQETVQKSYAREEFSNVKLVAKCKTTLCRVDFDASGAAKPDVAVRMLALHRPWPSQTFMRVNTDTNQAELYLSRENYQLPQADGPL